MQRGMRVEEVSKVIFNGRAAAKHGENLLIDCGNEGGLIQIKQPNDDVAWALYCKNLKITVEVMPDDDASNG